MLFYMACLLKFRIRFFLAQVTLETSQVHYDNWYHVFFLRLFPKNSFSLLPPITTLSISNQKESLGCKEIISFKNAPAPAPVFAPGLSGSGPWHPG